MQRTLPLAIGVSCLVVITAWTAAVRAQPDKRRHPPQHQPQQPTSESTQSAAPALLRAAELALDEGRHADAARLFVQADGAERSMAALGRAFEAANESGDPLLIVQVSERILSRPEVSDGGRTLARRAVAKASDRLTQLELVCGERACEFEVDGQVTSEGISYWLPGVHTLKLKDSEEPAIEAKCAARAICRFTLPLTRPSVAAAQPLTPALSPLALAIQAEQAVQPAPDLVSDSDRERKRKASRLPLGVLISSSIGAGVLGSLAIWSGVEAIQARNLHDTNPAAYDADAVRTHARRTDYLLLGAGACAGLAVATAVWWINWDERRSTSLSLDGGTMLRATQRF